MCVKQIPNIISFLNLLFGVAAIICAYEGKYTVSASFILISAFFDYIDGKIALRLNAVTHFGKELDSLADLVSFGVAPAVLTYAAAMRDLGFAGLALLFLYVACGAFRLAKFNVGTRCPYFSGLPIPVAGAIIAAAVLLRNPWIYTILVALFSVLMVSGIKIPRF